MGTLEQVLDMTNRGVPETEIINSLQEQGISPKEINNALNQAQIKNAVTNQNQMENIEPPTMDTAENYQYNEDAAPQTQDFSTQEYAPQEGYYPQEDYAQPTGGNADTMIEIASQVFSEKNKKIQDQIDELIEFKTLTQTKIDDLTQRVKRMETIIDKLQISILEKVGSYGNNLDNVKKEMRMMQDSFGKIINPLAKIAEKEHRKTKKK